MAANIFDHPIVLLIVVLFGFVRWLVSKGKTPTQDTPPTMESPPPQPILRQADTRSEEERIRKFLEALGQPAGTPPPKVTPRPRPVTPKIFPSLPPLVTKPPPLPREQSLPVPPPMPIEPARSPRLSPLETDYQVYDVARQSSGEPTPESRQPLAARSVAQIKLGTRQDLRTAIVLREIFGPPRSLQPLDLTSGT
jgi:hypothetical protein